MIARGGGGTTANQQWELLAMKTATAPGRIDYMEYDPSDPASTIELVELKVGGANTVKQTQAKTQVDGYVNNFPSPGSHPVEAKHWTTPYLDNFSIAERCDSNATRQVKDYRVQSATGIASDGVVMVTEVNRRDEDCDDDPGDPPHWIPPIVLPVDIVKYNDLDITSEIRQWMDDNPDLVEDIKKAATAAGVAAAIALAVAAIPALSAFGVSAPAVFLITALLLLGHGGILRADAYWYTSSDTLNVWDRYEEGWGAKANWVRGANSGSCVNETGAGSNKICSYSFGAGKSFSYQLCSKNGSTTLGCTTYLDDVT